MNTETGKSSSVQMQSQQIAEGEIPPGGNRTNIIDYEVPPHEATDMLIRRARRSED